MAEARRDKTRAAPLESDAESLFVPRIVVAGTGSGVGKTSITLGLIAALRRRGHKVAAFKIGPDYLDVTHLTRACGGPAYNLDGWMTDHDYVRDLFFRKTRGADIGVVEGAMGFYDGLSPISPEGSAAEVARILNAPVILTLHAHGVARSVAAMVKGYASLEPDAQIAGVIANHCGSVRHGEMLRQTLDHYRLPRLLGAIPRNAAPSLAGRHLGLVTATRDTLPDATLEAWADAVDQFVDVEALLGVARSARPLAHTGAQPSRNAAPASLRLGLALDDAFHFYYQDNLEELEVAGCAIVPFSPLTDARLPPDLDALYLGGGYPELFAERLSANESMVRDVRDFANGGGAVYAECGGLMYLSRGIELTSGARVPMTGVIPLWTRMRDKLKSLGYVEVQLREDGFLGRAGTAFRGHEFHYSEVIEDRSAREGWRPPYSARARRTDGPLAVGFMKGRVTASYVHAHFASRPHCVRAFTDYIAGARSTRESL
jgi:cobyrinic acid a,c-diamide synthase